MVEEASTDLVAVWEIHLADGVHMIELEHGTTSGKRVVRINREEILRKEWMFKLVGTESFNVGKNRTLCVIKIEPVGGFTYQYSLEVRNNAPSLISIALIFQNLFLGWWEIFQEVHRDSGEDNEDLDPARGGHDVPGGAREGHS